MSEMKYNGETQIFVVTARQEGEHDPAKLKEAHIKVGKEITRRALRQPGSIPYVEIVDVESDEETPYRVRQFTGKLLARNFLKNKQ